MANDCLVSKMIGSVDNNNLPKFNTFIYRMVNPSAVTSIIMSDCDYKILRGVAYAESELTNQRPSSGHCGSDPFRFYSPANQEILEIEVSSKYTLTRISGGTSVAHTMNFNDLNYSPLTIIGLRGVSPDRNDVVGSIEEFVKAQATFREVNNTIEFNWDYSKITLNNAYHKQKFMPTIITFNENNVVLSTTNESYIADHPDGVIATYSKTTNEWTYAQNVW